MLKPLALAAGLLGLCASPGLAAELTGIWQTAPDAKKTFGHVQITPCASGLCGTVIRAYDQTGAPIVTPSVGRRVLWNIDAAGRGRVYVPIMAAEFPVSLSARGNNLHLRACNGAGICRSQTWRRVQ